MQHILYNMKKDFLLLSLLILSFSVFAQTRESINNLHVAEDTVIIAADQNRSKVESILTEVKRIEEFISANEDKVELMATTRGSQKPMKVVNGEWPDMVNTSINILRRPNGQIYYYAEYPMSESGDWFIGYSHYFDKEGNVVAFKRIANFFNAECTDEVAIEKSVYTFDNKHNLTSKTYSLTDSNGIDLSQKLCWFNYDYDYTIGQTISDVEK